MYMHKLTWDLFIIMYMHKLTWGFVYHYVHAQIKLTWVFVYHYAHTQINMGICLSLCTSTN